MLSEPRGRTVAFDLDDTLYWEADYVKSSKIALGSFIESVFERSITNELLSCSNDFIALACELLALPSTTKETLLWIVRTHSPSICLKPDAAKLIADLRRSGNAVCIVTDGRSVTQRLKIKALNLSVDAIYISQEIGCEKPNRKAYDLVERQWPSHEYWYIADNINKDFIAPNELGWNSVGIIPTAASIYKSMPSMVPESYSPSHWAERFEDVRAILES